MKTSLEQWQDMVDELDKLTSGHTILDLYLFTNRLREMITNYGTKQYHDGAAEMGTEVIDILQNGVEQPMSSEYVVTGGNLNIMLKDEFIKNHFSKYPKPSEEQK